MNTPKDLIRDELVKVAMTAYEHDGPCPCSHGGMRAALIAYESAKWQPIETAPKDGELVLLWDGHDCTLGQWFSGLWESVEGDIFDATHWMPLPELPL